MIDDLIKWNSRWRLNSHVVSCRVCLSRQDEADRGVAFSHLAGCWCGHENVDPWAELDKACRRTAVWNVQAGTSTPSFRAG